jgi:two-component system, chemotaxis family, protein-glutamate methylesterase/glutaminase
MATNVFIVDDSVVFRHLLSEIINGLPDAKVAGTAPNGSIALKKIARTPCEAVFLDVEMPVLDGIETLRKLREDYPEINVVRISGCSKEAAETTMTALNMGALEFISKPDAEDREQNIKRLTFEIQSVLRIIETRYLLRHAHRCPAAVRTVPAPSFPAARLQSGQAFQSFGIICIGVSTGGPNALIKLVSDLPGDFPLPIVTVQHMPANFTATLAENLNKKSALRIVEAREDMVVTRGTMIIAKGGRHMLIRGKKGQTVIGLSDSPPENSCRPAVDVLFRSVASLYGDTGVLSIIMTGMGSDGLAGLRTLKRKKCYCITQGESSCVVYGMPRVVDEAGLSDESVELDLLAERLVTLAKQSKPF